MRDEQRGPDLQAAHLAPPPTPPVKGEPVVVPAGATVGMRLGTRACPHRRPRFGGAIVDKRWGSSTDRQPGGGGRL